MSKVTQHGVMRLMFAGGVGPDAILESATGYARELTGRAATPTSTQSVARIARGMIRQAGVWGFKTAESRRELARREAMRPQVLPPSPAITS